MCVCVREREERGKNQGLAGRRLFVAYHELASVASSRSDPLSPNGGQSKTSSMKEPGDSWLKQGFRITSALDLNTFSVVCTALHSFCQSPLHRLHHYITKIASFIFLFGGVVNLNAASQL